MDKVTLEQYPDICAEIDELTRRTSMPVTDTVSGSTPDYPYTKHPISVHGVTATEEDYTRLAELQQQKAAVEEFVNGMELSKERRVTRKVMEYGAPIPWAKIAANLGWHWTIDKARYAYKKVCKKYF